MNICWVIAENMSDPLIDPETLADIGSTWGSWKTWRAWNTDNILCHNTKKAKDLTTRAFQAVCNLYIANDDYIMLGRPVGVKLYEGKFPTEFDAVEDIISMHLVSENNDVVLLLGFDVGAPEHTDPLTLHKQKSYLAAFKAVIKMYPATQWVLINHEQDLDPSLTELENLSCDNLDSVLELLGNI